MKYRPCRREYFDFINRFSEDLTAHFPDVCFGVFGSIVSGGAVYGRADIDGFLIMDNGVVSDKQRVMGLSQIFARVLSRSRLKTQFNLLDLESSVDGRFLSYTRDYTGWLKDSAITFSGPFHHLKMNGFDFKSGVLHSAAFNFSGPGGVRNAALYSLDLLQRDYDEFSERVEAAIGKVAKFPKKLIWLKTGKIISGRRESQKILQRHLGGVNYDLLDEINDVLDDVGELDRRLEDPEEALRLLYSGLEVMEQMVLSYIEKYPNIGKREARELHLS